MKIYGKDLTICKYNLVCRRFFYISFNNYPISTSISKIFQSIKKHKTKVLIRFKYFKSLLMPSVVRKRPLLVKSKLFLRSSSLALTQLNSIYRKGPKKFYEYTVNFIKIGDELMISQELRFFNVFER